MFRVSAKQLERLIMFDELIEGVRVTIGENEDIVLVWIQNRRKMT